MSRSQWIIIVVLALVTLAVVGGTGWVVVNFFRPAVATGVPTLAFSSTPQETATPQPTALPTWTPTASPSPLPTPTLRPTSPPTETPTAWPTFTPTPSPTPTPVALQNPTFDDIRMGRIPGWETAAFVNWSPGQQFDAGASFAEPRFHPADDPRQWINGSTLQIDTEPWVKLRAWVFQRVELTPGTRVVFSVRAVGFVKDTASGYILKAGVDPNGGQGCENARWSEEQIYNQNAGVVDLNSPAVTAGQAGWITVCMAVETQYAQVYHAAFFDDASLEVLSGP